MAVPAVRENDGTPNPYATRVVGRARADSAYLLLRRLYGHDEAAARTCAVYGHDTRAQVCDRCGRRVSREELRERLGGRRV